MVTGQGVPTLRCLCLLLAQVDFTLLRALAHGGQITSDRVDLCELESLKHNLCVNQLSYAIGIAYGLTKSDLLDPPGPGSYTAGGCSPGN